MSENSVCPVLLKPGECNNLGDVRACIDSLFSVIDILYRRMHYVQSAIRYKTDEASILAPALMAEMLVARCRYTEQ